MGPLRLNSYSKTPSLSSFPPRASQDGADSRLLFLYLPDKSFVSNLIFVRLTERFCVYLFMLTFCAASFRLNAQERCGFVEYTDLLRSRNLLFENSNTFEKWLQQKQSLKQRQNKAQRTQAAYQIPVVVHIIHNGEAVGS